MKRHDLEVLASENAGKAFGRGFAKSGGGDSSFQVIGKAENGELAYHFPFGLHVGYEGGGYYGLRDRFFNNRNLTLEDLKAIFQAGISDSTSRSVGVVPRWNRTIAESDRSVNLREAENGYPPGAKAFRTVDNAECVLVNDASKSNPDEADLDLFRSWNFDGRNGYLGTVAGWVRDQKTEALARFDGHLVKGVDTTWYSDYPTGIAADPNSSAHVESGTYKLCSFVVPETCLGIAFPFVEPTSTYQRLYASTQDVSFHGRMWITDTVGDEVGMTIASRTIYRHPNVTDDFRHGGNYNLPLMLFRKGVTYHIYASFANGYISNTGATSHAPFVVPFLRNRGGSRVYEQEVVILRYRHGLAPGPYEDAPFTFS